MMLHDVTRHCRTLQDAAGHCRILQNVSECCRINRQQLKIVINFSTFRKGFTFSIRSESKTIIAIESVVRWMWSLNGI